MADQNIERRLSHDRQIRCQGYKRSDGLWDIEAHITDTKGIVLRTPDRPLIPVGELLHDMTLCLTIDSNMEVKAVSASMDATPYAHCPQIAEAYQKLVGISINAGWIRKTRELFSGIHGCTHLKELLGPMATVAFQTVVDESYHGEGCSTPPDQFKVMINQCHGLNSESDVVKTLWSDSKQEEKIQG